MGKADNGGFWPKILKAATPAWRSTPAMIKGLVIVAGLVALLAWLNPWKKESPTSQQTAQTKGDNSPAYTAGHDIIVNAQPPPSSDATKTAFCALTGWTNIRNRSATISGLTGVAITQSNADGTGFSYGTVTTPMNVVIAPGGRLNGKEMTAAFIHANDSDAPQININGPNYGNVGQQINPVNSPFNQTIVTPVPKPRRILGAQKESLVKALSIIPKQNVQIESWAANAECRTLSCDVKAAFSDAGFPVDEGIPDIMAPLSNPTEIVVIHGSETSVHSVLKAFTSLGFTASHIPNNRKEGIIIYVLPKQP